MADVGVFSRYKGFADFQEEARKTGLAEALTMAQIKKAQEPDYDRMAQEAFIQASTVGVDSLSPTQKALLVQKDAAQQTYSFNPVTGRMEQKPSLLERAGINLGSPQQQAAAQPITPKNSVVKPDFQKYMTGPISGGAPAPADSPDFLTEIANSNKVGEGARADEYIKNNPLPLTPAQRRQQKQQQELASAGNNPKLQQTIREKYVTAESPTVKFEQENKLRDEFNNIAKPFREMQDAYSKVQNISDSAAGDIALLYATAKLNDPTSVVRESEFAIQAAAGSFGDRIQNLVQKVTKGNRLTPSQRQQLKDETDNLYRAQIGNYQNIKKQYEAIGYENELNSKNIIADYANPINRDIPATPAMKPADIERSLFNARKAIRNNPANRDAVIQRLEQAGIPAGGL